MMQHHKGNRFEKLVLNRAETGRRLGAGALLQKSGAGVDATASTNAACAFIKQGMAAQPHFLPVCHEVQASMLGALPDATVQKFFGPQIKPMNWNEETPFPYVQTTLWDGQPLMNFIVFAIGVHLETSPISFSATGNCWTRPATATSVVPNSPNAWTQSDIANSAFGVGVADTNYFKAQVEAGAAWQAAMFYHFCRAYNLYWQVSNNQAIVNNLLRTIAFSPSLAQKGSASSSEVGVVETIREGNTQYGSTNTNAGGGSASLTFLRENAIRLGSLSLNPPTVNGVLQVAPYGNFMPTRSGDLAGVTFGGGAMGAALDRDLRNNGEYVKLENPYIVEAGHSTGILFQEVDSFQGDLFRAMMSMTYGMTGASVPPALTDDPNILPGYNDGLIERCSDDPTANFLQKTKNEVYSYKFGPWKLTTRLMGYELSKDEYEVLCGPAARAMIQQTTPCRFSAYSCSQ